MDKKLTDEKKKKLIWPAYMLFFACVFAGLFFAEAKLSYFLTNDFSGREQIIDAEDVSQYMNYSVENGTFVPVAEDPQLYVKCDMEELTSVTIELSQPVAVDTPVQAFVYDGGYQERDSHRGCILAGEKLVEIRLFGRSNGDVRIDIDGSFSLGRVVLSGKAVAANRTKQMLYWVIIVLADAAALVVVVRNRMIMLRLLTRGRAVAVKCFKRIAGVVNACDAAVLRMGRKLKINIIRFYIVAALVTGIGYSVLIPVGCVPDEETHVEQMALAFGTAGVFEQYHSVMWSSGTLDAMHMQKQPIDKQALAQMAGIHFDKTQISRQAPTWRIVKYFPAGIGFYLGLFLNLPILACAQLGEFTALLFSVMMGVMTLRLLPAKRELMCAILLLPMNLHQCASFNYDAVLLPACYFFVAYILYLCDADRDTGWRDVLILAVTMGCIVLVKTPYALLALLYFMIPRRKRRLRIGSFDVTDFVYRYRWGLLALAAVVALAGAYVFRETLYVQNILLCILRPYRVAKTLYGTLRGATMYYLRGMVAYFGWFDIPASSWFVCFVLVSLLAFSQIQNHGENCLAAMPRVLTGAVCLFVTGLIFAGFLIWTMEQNGLPVATLAQVLDGMAETTHIAGVQGRYFLPYLFCIYLFWDGALKIRDNKLILWQILYYVVTIIVPLRMILTAVW